MSYVRVDWDNDTYEYLKNDIMGDFGEMRASLLYHSRCIYKRLKRMNKLPVGKQADKIYYKRRNKK